MLHVPKRDIYPSQGFFALPTLERVKLLRVIVSSFHNARAYPTPAAHATTIFTEIFVSPARPSVDNSTLTSPLRIMNGIMTLVMVLGVLC